jgi:hypothetical protein
VFDEETLPLSAIESIGVAANNAYGITTVAVMKTATRTVTYTNWNLPRSLQRDQRELSGVTAMCR